MVLSDAVVMMHMAECDHDDAPTMVMLPMTESCPAADGSAVRA